MTDIAIDLLGIDLADCNNGWVAGEEGAILQLDNGTWNVVPSPITSTLRALSVDRRGDGWAVGDYGTILRLADKVWSRVESPTDFDLRDVAEFNEHWWAVGGVYRGLLSTSPSEGIVLVFSDEAWEVHSTFPDHVVHSLAVENDKSLWVTGGRIDPKGNDGWIIANLRYDDPWITWDMTTRSTWDSRPLYAISISHENGWAVGEAAPYQNAYHYSSGRWERLRGTADVTLFAVSTGRAGEMWAVGARGVAINYSNGKVTRLYMPNGEDLYDIEISDDNCGWAVGESGTILRYTGEDRSLSVIYVPRVFLEK
jgi:photosystem II stability/assembly factor-like uncharacterized protein